MQLELRRGGYKGIFNEVPFVSVNQRSRLLEFALELQVLSKVADHVDLLLQVAQVLLLVHYCTVVLSHDVNT